jgi:hypothetical protein
MRIISDFLENTENQDTLRLYWFIQNSTHMIEPLYTEVNVSCSIYTILLRKLWVPRFDIGRLR